MDLRVQDSVQAPSGHDQRRGVFGGSTAVVSRSGAALREKLGVGKTGPGETEVVHAALPATPDAARFYADGSKTESV